jgi:hypothetical protein
MPNNAPRIEAGQAGAFPAYHHHECVSRRSLVTADATSGTPLFAIAKPGMDATLDVPELPGRSFKGKIARTANARGPREWHARQARRPEEAGSGSREIILGRFFLRCCDASAQF